MAGVIPDPETIRAVYDRQAASYDANRGRHGFETRWLDRFAAGLPQGGDVLDLGCGAGDPIAVWLKSAGYRVVGVDFSDAMLSIARARIPDGDWRLMDMRDLNLPETFDGVIAWNSFFHLTAEAQTDVIARVARHLRHGGLFLTTVGPGAGEVTGTVGTEAVYHASLAPEGYANCLAANDMTLRAFVAEDPECAGHTVLLARKYRLPGPDSHTDEQT